MQRRTILAALDLLRAMVAAVAEDSSASDSDSDAVHHRVQLPTLATVTLGPFFLLAPCQLATR